MMLFVLILKYREIVSNMIVDERPINPDKKYLEEYLESLEANVVREIVPAVVGYGGYVSWGGTGCGSGCGGVEEDWAVIIESSVMPVLDVGGEVP